MGIGFRELLIILLIALVLFGAKKLKNVCSDLGSAVRGFKKAMNEGEDEQNKQLTDMTGSAKDADFKDRTTASASRQARPDSVLGSTGDSSSTQLPSSWP